jgi:hypothetical protein
MKFDVTSSEIHGDNNDYNVNINQKQDHEEDKRNQYDQHSIVQIADVNDKQTNQAQPAK